MSSDLEALPASQISTHPSIRLTNSAPLKPKEFISTAVSGKEKNIALHEAVIIHSVLNS